MRSRVPGLILIVFVFLARVTNASDSSTAIQPDQDAAFISQIQSWVDGNLESIGGDKTRYVLRRIRCDIKSSTDDKRLAEKENEVTLQDDIERCKTKMNNFYCKVATKMIDERFVGKNDIYYDYCMANRR